MPQVQIRKIESYDPAALDAAVKSFLREMPLSRVNRS